VTLPFLPGQYCAALTLNEFNLVAKRSAILFDFKT
jgi:hypothetical protein